jgi:hypothetical protein
MTEVIEGVAVALDTSKPENLQKCDWKNCEKTHTKSISYPSGGTVDRNSSYASAWASAGLEPWKLYGDGTDSRAKLPDFRKETPAAAYAVSAAALKHPEYHTQKHHLISINLFKSVADLSHNAKLIGYDVNHKKNGSCFPSYVADIVRHDLQCHRGRHPKLLYNDNVDPLLRAIEKRCLAYCELDVDGDTTRQQDLIDDLNRLSARCYNQIRAWKWLLRSAAIAERAQSRARLAGLQP